MKEVISFVNELLSAPFGFRCSNIDWVAETDYFDTERLRNIILLLPSEDYIPFRESIEYAWEENVKEVIKNVERIETSCGIIYKNINEIDLPYFKITDLKVLNLHCTEIRMLTLNNTLSNSVYKLKFAANVSDSYNYDECKITDFLDDVYNQYKDIKEKYEDEETVLSTLLTIKERRNEETNLFQQNTTEPQQVCGEEKGMNDKVEALTLELHKKQEAIDSLKQQLEELRKCHNDLKEEYQNKSVPESGNQRLTDCENEEIIKQARKDGMRELVEQLIVYAENENQEAAREIKFALMAKMVNCIITPDILTPELKERLDNLGRKKENNMIFYNSVGAVVANASQVSFPNNKE